MRIVVCLLALGFFSAGSLDAGAIQQGAAPIIDYETARLSRVARAVAIDTPIALDGHLLEDAWSSAEPATDFIQGGRSPNPGHPSSQRTEVRFLYDAENLYVAFTCFEEDMSRLVTSGLTRDFPPNLGDEIGITISPLNDNRSGFFFSTNPAGARRDLQLSNDGQVNQDWHGVWDLQVGLESDRWIVELVIPFKTMRFSDDPVQEWAVNMLRTMRGHSNEQSTWSPLPIRYNLSRISMAGKLIGLQGIKQGRNLNVKPYMVAGLAQAQGTDGRLESNADKDGGVDLKYGLTSQLTLDATYRTDFSQAEVDQNQVNLTRFNLFFPEKREFFLENSGIFNFGDRATGGNLLPFFSRRIGLSAAGLPIPIIGGARVSGSLGNQEIGFLAMKTERAGLLPSNNFVVARVKRNLLRNSFAGFIFTSRDSRDEDDHNRVYGVDSVLQFYNRLDIGGYLLKSDTPNLETDDDARRLLLRWQDDIFTLGADYEKVGENFKPDVGFIRRGSMSHYSGNAAWNPRVESNLIRDLTFRGVYDYYANVDGEIETRSDDLSFGMNFESGAVLSLSRNQTFERLESEFTRYSIPAGDYQYSTYTASYNSDRSRRLGGRISYSQGGFWNGNARSISGDFTIKPNYHWQGDFTYSRNDISVEAGEFPTTLLGLKLLYAFNNRAFLNSFFQFDAANRQLTTNIRFSLMHRPLSDLFVVFTERRDTRGGFIVDRGLIFKLTNLFQF